MVSIDIDGIYSLGSGFDKARGFVFYDIERELAIA